MSETSTQRLARLLTLVPWLRANNGITISEAAEHFGVDTDQLTTDLWQLIVCGIPGYGPDQLVDIQFWDDDRIHVIDAMALDRPLRLSGEEVAALHVALRVLAQVPGEHDRQALLTAMAKLEQAGAPEVRMDIDVAVAPEVLELVTSAIQAQGWLSIDYAGADSDQIESRRIKPMASYAVDGQVYLQAWCEVAGDLRTFRLDRVHRASRVHDVDAPVTATSPGAMKDRPHGVPAETTSLARIAIDPDALWIVDTEPLSNVSSTDGSVQALIAYASLEWLVRWVLGHGGRVRVLEPPEAREAVRRAAQERLAAG